MDEKIILTLIDKFSGGHIGELDLSDGNSRLILRKEASSPSPAAGEPVHLGFPAPLVQHPAAPGSSAPGQGGGPRDSAPGGEFITSPIVGTFYPSPSPDAPSFVRPGSKVKAGDTLCILEAMKMMNHLEAEFDCEIIAVKAAGGDLVEFGQKLFEVRRGG
ncbi:MAG: acetyl-CoA carboxylase biotin carboxyl carrier protein [Spirochaetaceae bacterium]|jgi:acetyl-CoA carboxylase biotin carboxyl carrier protein|nr:acetyl-CoA carboxylase biotin carboxyl carrier protein [Spirochaetaceae bacterium]